MAGTVVVGGNLTGLPVGQISVGPYNQAANTGNNLQIQTPTFTSGFNSFSVPTWAVGMLLVPNTSNAVGWTLKGITGDTGLPLALALPFGPYMFPASPPATLGITAAANFTTITEIIFF